MMNYTLRFEPGSTLAISVLIILSSTTQTRKSAPRRFLQQLARHLRICVRKGRKTVLSKTYAEEIKRPQMK